MLRRRRSARSRPELAGGTVDGVFERDRGLRSPGPAIGAGGSGGGEHSVDLGADRRRAVRTREAAEVDEGGIAAEPGEVGPESRETAKAHGPEHGVRVETDFDLHEQISGLVVGEKGLAALSVPLDGTAESPRRPEDQRGLREYRGAQAESATEVRTHHPDSRLRHPEHVLREAGADRVRRLRAFVEDVAAVEGIVVPDGRARLHGVRAHAADREPAPHPVHGLRKRTLHPLMITHAHPETRIVRALVPERRRPRRARRADRRDPRQGVVVHRDPFRRILRRQCVLRHDERDRVSDERNFLFRQSRARGRVDRRAVGAGETASPRAGSEADRRRPAVRSAAVKIPSAPGARAASMVSIERIRAWA